MSPADVLRSAVPERRRFAWALALAILTNASAVALLATSMWLIVSAAYQPPILWLSFAVVGVRAFALGRATFRYAERLVSHDAVFRRLPALRSHLYNRLAELAPWGITGAQRGDTLSRFVRDVDELQFFPLRVVLPSWSAVVVVLGSVALAGIVAPVVALIQVGVLTLGTVLAAATVWRNAERTAREIAPARGTLADAVLDAAENWDVLVAYGADARATERVERAGAELSQREQRVAGTGGLANAILIIAGAATIALSWMALSSSSLPVPSRAVLLLVPIALIDVLAAIPIAIHARAAAEGAAARISALLPNQTPAGIPDERLAIERDLHDVTDHTLRVRGLTARYPGAESEVLRGVDFDLASGELLVLTGPSGAGKSTIAQVLVRLLDYTGSVTMGGRELRELGAATARTEIVLCEQQPWLFSSTIRGNLQFARPHGTDDDLHRVLERVGLTEWVAGRGGLDAEVGERGELISGGQAQRIALARALLSEAAIIVCDEPTANVDPVVAERLLRDIASLAPARSVLVISHQALPSDISARTVRIDDGHLR